MTHPPNPAILAACVSWLKRWAWTGNLTILDLIAASSSALKGAELTTP